MGSRTCVLAIARWAFLLGAMLPGLCTADAALAKGKQVIQPFDYKGVTLDDGTMRRRFDEARDYYLRIPNDDLLKGFRARAGKPSPGVDLGGWYSDDVFNLFGQLVSGLSRMYAATGDQACKDKADLLIQGWSECIEPDGYFFYSRKPNAPNYTYDKMVCGLLDAYLYCGNKKALTHLSRITDWAEKNLERTNVYAFNSARGATEWYTLSENLYRAYLATGNKRHRDYARVWEFTDFWNALAVKGDIFERVGRYHAYSHVNTLSGPAAAYLVTGEKHYLDTLINAYDYLQGNQCYATGGYGPDESLLPRDKLRQKLYDSHNSFETPCGSWAAFKMSKYLMSFTGDARYGDWIERLVINGIGASLPIAPDGTAYYFSDYNVGGGAKRNMHRWACCAGTWPQAVADLHDLIYFRDAGGIYVNLFSPSTVKWKHSGSTVILTQQTWFPENERVEIIVSIPQTENEPSPFSINVRVPGWLAGDMRASVNGKPVKVAENKTHWATFRRTWKDGDRLSIVLPMSFRAAKFPLSSDKEYPVAILQGPVVLAFRSPDSNPSKLIDLDNLSGSFVPSPGEGLTYHLTADPTVLVRPFYAFKADERYYMYLDTKCGFVSVPHEHLTYIGEWQDFGRFHMTTKPGSTMEHTFEGTGVRWRIFKFDDAGRAEVSIDGKVEEVVDLFAPARDVPFVWERTSLQPGKHTIRIKLLEEKHPDSRNRYINIASLEIVEDGQTP